MQPLPDQPRVNKEIAGGLRSRRGLVLGSLRVAGGAGLALAAAGSPALLHTAWAQDDDDGGGDDDDGGGAVAAPVSLPNTGVGAGDQMRMGGWTAALAGLAAIGAAVAAFVTRRTA